MSRQCCTALVEQKYTFPNRNCQHIAVSCSKEPLTIGIPSRQSWFRFRGVLERQHSSIAACGRRPVAGASGCVAMWQSASLLSCLCQVTGTCLFTHACCIWHCRAAQLHSPSQHGQQLVRQEPGTACQKDDVHVGKQQPAASRSSGHCMHRHNSRRRNGYRDFAEQV